MPQPREKERENVSGLLIGPKAMTLAILRQFARVYSAPEAYHPSLRGFVAN